MGLAYSCMTVAGGEEQSAVALSVERGDADAVVEAVRSHPQLLTKRCFASGSTLWHLAARQGQTTVVRALLASVGASLEHRCGPACTCSCRDSAVAASVRGTPSCSSSSSSSSSPTSSSSSLLPAAPVAGQHPAPAAAAPHPELARILGCCNDKAQTPLHVACCHGSAEVAKALLQQVRARTRARVQEPDGAEAGRTYTPPPARASARVCARGGYNTSQHNGEPDASAFPIACKCM